MNEHVSEDDLSKLRDALQALEDPIWTKDDLDAAAITVDVLASILADVLKLTLGSQSSSASQVFSELVQHGLSTKAEAFASELADIASLKIYDDDEESESKLEDAESTRQAIYDCLKKFIESLSE